MKYCLLGFLFLLFKNAPAQFTEDDYKKLSKGKLKNERMLLYAAAGLWGSHTKNVFTTSKYSEYPSSYQTNNPLYQDRDSSYDNILVFGVDLSASFTPVLTRHFLASLEGNFQFGYYPSNSSSADPAYSGIPLNDDFKSEGRDIQINYNVNGKVGGGFDAVKLFIGAGIGNININRRYLYEQEGSTYSNSGYITIHDTANYKLSFFKVATGLHFKLNKRNFIQVQVYKMLPNSSFYKATEKEDLISSLTNFDDIGLYPPLPMGLSFSYTFVGVGTLNFTYNKYRDIDRRPVQATNYTISIQKHFNFSKRR